MCLVKAECPVCSNFIDLHFIRTKLKIEHSVKEKNWYREISSSVPILLHHSSRQMWYKNYLEWTKKLLDVST